MSLRRSTTLSRVGLLRRVVAVAVSSVVAIAAVLFSPIAASAAPGDLSLTLTAPATVGLGKTFNYTVTVELEGVDSSHPAAGVQLTTTLAPGTRFESVPTGSESPVERYSYDPSSRTLTLTLRETTQSVLSIVYTVAQTEVESKYEGMPFATSISGSGGPSGPAVSNSVLTTLVGDNDYFARKTFEVVTGGDNRTVTYRFNLGTSHADDGSTFSTMMQRFTDVFPSGAQLVSTSPDWNGGSWDTTAWPAAVWERAGAYGPSGSSFDTTGQQIWLTVYYPNTVTGWEDGQRPPENTVNLETADIVSVNHPGTPSSTRAPAFLSGGGPGIASSKSDEGLTSAGMLSHLTHTGASYVGPADAPNLDELVLTDSGAAGEANESWFKHTEISQIFVTFSSGLTSLNLPYKLEYQTNGGATWTEYTGYLPGDGTTAQPLVLAVQNDGSTGWRANSSQSVIDLPNGSVLSGWRFTLAPGVESVPVSSEVKVRMAFQPVFRDVADGVFRAPAPAGVSPGTLTNTVSVTGGGFASTASSNYTPVDSVYVTTAVRAPNSLSVGAAGSISASIINQNPSETYSDSQLSVVLPCGVYYDETRPITPDPTTVGVAAAPEVGSGVTVSAGHRVTDANGCEQQVVRFSFDALPPMRAPSVAKDRWVEGYGWTYNIPVSALAQAYLPDEISVPTLSFATVADPRFLSVAAGGSAAATIEMIGYSPSFGPDRFDFDPARSTVAVSRSVTTINTAGGLLISKLSSASAAGPWGLNSTVGTEAFWQIYVSDILPNPVSGSVFFDKLPSLADGADFDSQLAGAVSGIPSAATVEYSLDATSATTGTWTSDPTAATAFRVSVPTLTVGSSFTLVVPVSNLGELRYGQSASNRVAASGSYNGNPVAFGSNAASVTVFASPALALVKKTNGVEYSAAPGAIVAVDSPVTWTYELTNTGDTALDAVAISDSFTAGDGSTGTLTPTSSATGILAPGETRTFTASGVAIAGQYQNSATATATAVDAAGSPLAVQPEAVTDDSWYLAGESGVTVVKTTNGHDIDSAPGLPLDPGSTVTWEYLVTNTGTVPLTNIAVEDVAAAGPIVFSGVVPSLAPGEWVTLSASGTAISGQYHNTVSVSAVDPTGGDRNLTAADDSWYFGSVPGIAVVKQVSEAATGPWTDSVQVAAGARAYWRITVTNTGNSTLTDVIVADPKLGQTIRIGTLAAGESTSTVVTLDHVTEGFTNTATATGITSGGVTITASGEAEVSIIPVAAGAAGPWGLAATGLGVAGGVTAAMLLLTAGAVLMIRRRRGAAS